MRYQPAPEEEKESLRAMKETLQQDLKDIDARLKELETKK
jgi:hypothetical protein